MFSISRIARLPRTGAEHASGAGATEPIGSTGPIGPGRSRGYQDSLACQGSEG